MKKKIRTAKTDCAQQPGASPAPDEVPQDIAKETVTFETGKSGSGLLEYRLGHRLAARGSRISECQALAGKVSNHPGRHRFGVTSI